MQTEPIIAITYDDCPFLKTDASVKAVLEKDSIHSDISLQKGAFFISYGFIKNNKTGHKNQTFNTKNSKKL